MRTEDGRNRHLLMCLLAGGLLAAPGLTRAQTSIEVDGSVRLEPISRNLFGKFTEHLGRNVYQGAWAQMVVNPELAPASLWLNGEGIERGSEAASEGVRARWIEPPYTAVGCPIFNSAVFGTECLALVNVGQKPPSQPGHFSSASRI